MGCRRRGTAVSENSTACGRPGEDGNRPTLPGGTLPGHHKNQVETGERLAEGTRPD